MLFFFGIKIRKTHNFILVILLLIAHRGISNQVVKENTIPAFLGAIHNDQYSGFELDIYTSKDREFVVHHDPMIDGKLIWNYTSKELKKKGVCRLEEVLKLETDKIILIDIKDIHLNIKKFIKLIQKYKKKNIYVMSFFRSVIEKFPQVSFKVGLLNYVLNSTPTYSYDFIGILYDVASFHMIDAFQKLNIEVFLYGIHKNDPFIYSNVYYIVDAY